MIILIIIGVVLAVSFVVNWARSDALKDPLQKGAAKASVLSFGGLVILVLIATIVSVTSI